MLDKLRVVSLSMFRRLFCTSFSHPNLHQRYLLSISYRNFQNTSTLPGPTLISLLETCSVERFQNIKSFRRFSFLYSQMARSRRHLSVSIPAFDKVSRSELLRSLESSLGSSFSSDSLLPNPNPLIIVISGPSGVGKYAVLKKLKETREDLHFVVTATSRAKRPGEMNGKDYYFVTKEDFLSMVERGELMEYAIVYGDYKGVPKQQIRDYVGKGYDIVLRVDIQGAQTLRRVLGKSAVFIFLVTENEMAMVERLVDRKTETAESLLVRIASAREEVKHVKRFDYVVVNAKGKLENAVKQVESIIDAEKAKVRPRNAVRELRSFAGISLHCSKPVP